MWIIHIFILTITIKVCENNIIILTVILPTLTERVPRRAKMQGKFALQI